MSFIRKKTPGKQDHCILLPTMPDSFFSYMEWIELETCFSGYILVYAIVHLLASNGANTGFAKLRLLPKLPMAYAFAGTIYLALQLKNAYPDYSLDHLTAGVQLPYLKIWGLLSVLCWISVLRRKAVFSILHSSVFLFLLLKNLCVQLFTAGGDDMVRNDMKVYSASILLNVFALGLVTIATLLIDRLKIRKPAAPF